jgi:hypothetical protein
MKQDLMSDPFTGMGMLERGPFSSPTSTQLFESRFSINLNFKLEKMELTQREHGVFGWPELDHDKLLWS